jgi:glycosyltransferase involved in cell wall biosynthesis
MPPPLRVLFVTPRYQPYTGGVETHVAQVARRVAAAGAAVTVLTTDVGRTLPREEQRDGVTIRRVRAYPARRDYYFAPELYRAIAQGPWDIVHVQSYHTLVAPLAMLAACRARLPYVVTFHGGGHSSRLRHALRGAQQWALRPLLARAAQLIAVARFEVELYSKRLRLPEQRFVVVPNGADLTAMIPASLPAPDGTLIASVGRLERYKGHQRAIAALPRVLARRPDARLWIAGTGPYESELRQLADQLGIADRVEIRAVPASDRAGMAAALARTALVVLLSEYETHPVAVLEALCLKRPVLVAHTSGLAELADRGWVRAVPLDSTPAQIASAMLDQLQRPVLPADLHLPSWDDCANGLLALYQSIVRRAPCVS